MNRIFLILCFCTVDFSLIAQKPVIDSSVYQKWPSVGDAKISNNGKYALYWINNEPVGSQTLIISSTDGSWRKLLPGVPKGVPYFTRDSRKAIVKLSGDSLAIFTLGEIRTEVITHVKSFRITQRCKDDWFAYQSNIPGEKCIIRNLQTGRSYTWPNTIDYVFDEIGGGIILRVWAVTGKDSGQNLIWLDLFHGKSSTIWKGEKCNIYYYSFGQMGSELAFITGIARNGVLHSAIWEYNSEREKANLLICDTSREMPADFSIANEGLNFSKDGRKVFFRIRRVVNGSGILKRQNGVNIWNYRDVYLQSVQLSGYSPSNLAKECCVNIDSRKMIILSEVDERLIFFEKKDNNQYVLVYKMPAPDAFYKGESRPSLFLESIVDGARVLVNRQFNFNSFKSYEPIISPEEKFVVWFDIDSLCYFSYEIASGAKKNLSRMVPTSVYDTDAARVGRYQPFGIGGWLQKDIRLLIYDQYDIWKVDPCARTEPINITHFVGQKKHIVFGIVHSGISGASQVIDHPKCTVSAYDRDSKANGLLVWNTESTIEWDKSIMDSRSYWIERVGITGHIGYRSAGRPIKALDAEVYLVKRMSASESPNIFVTTDFKSFYPLSAVYPEREYNWITDELITWKMSNGKFSQGILYKPENFDSSKKYPIIFEYYEKRSDELHEYIMPDFCHDRINISSYVSNGYLVFVPDIYYEPGKNGAGVVNSIVSAARYLSRFGWVDSTRLGLQGHSFGGWETNFLITHSHIFAAACEAAGVSDQVSSYGELEFGTGLSRQELYEMFGQGSPFGIGVTPWTASSLYIENSPIFFIDSITTPLLMMHCRQDVAVPFEQAVELFMGMKRAGKRVWLLEYDEGNHSLFGNEARDYTFRMQQFFNHYLKSASAPLWMTRGIPANVKGIESGLELDANGIEP